MPPIQTRVSHFLLWKRLKGDAYVRTIAPDLSEKTQQHTGLIFGVLKADAAGHVGDALAAHIEDALVRGLSEAVRRLPASAGQEAVFESAVSRVNESLSRIINERRLAVRFDGIDGLLLSQKGVDVIAAAWGQPTLLLFHPTKDNKIKVYDLMEEDGSGSGIPPGRRGFLHLITGRVSCGDKLLVSTEDLRSVIGPEELAPIIADNDPEAATAILNDVFSAKRMNGPLALFVADATECGMTADGNKPARRLSSATQRSIEKLLSTESQTRSIMSPALVPSLVKNMGIAVVSWFRSASESLNRVDENETAEASDAATETGPAEMPDTSYESDEFRTGPEPAEAALPEETRPTSDEEELRPTDDGLTVGGEYPTPETGPADGMRGWISDDEIDETMPMTAPGGIVADTEMPDGPVEPAVPKRPKVLAVTAGRMARAGADALKSIVGLVSKDRRNASWKGLRHRIDGGLTGLVRRFNNLPAASRYILLALLAVIYVFNISLTFAGWQRQREEAAASYDRTTASIHQKIDSAEASLIYRDEVRARELLGEAETMVAALPNRTQNQKMIREALTKKIETKYDAIRREVRLEAPEVVAGIAMTQETPVLTRLTRGGDVIWAASAGGEVFRIIPKDGTAEKTGDSPGGAPAVFVAAGNSLLTGDGGGQLAAISSGGRAVTKTVELNGTEIMIADADLYNNRLYLLDPTHNRILKLEPTVKGYAQAQHYLKDGTDVSTAVSMSIDGLVYVLLRDGTIVKLIKGTRDPAFNAARPEPAITSPARIRSWVDADYLYVLDTDPARLLSFDKETGALSAQYVSDALVGASDFLVDEEARTILVASGNNLLRFSLPEQK